MELDGDEGRRESGLESVVEGGLGGVGSLLVRRLELGVAEKDCSKGLGSRSKLERVGREGCFGGRSRAGGESTGERDMIKKKEGNDEG